MNPFPKKTFFVVVALQLLVLGAMIVRQTNIVERGTPILLECLPRDPRSLFSGDYVVLNYKISRLGYWWNWSRLNPDKETFRRHRAVYVAMEKPADSQFWQPIEVSNDMAKLRRKHAVVMRGSVRDISHQATPEYPVSLGRHDISMDFVNLLRQDGDAVVRHVRSLLQPETLQQLTAYDPANPTPERLRDMLVMEFNRLLLLAPLYEPSRCEGIKLGEETQRMIAQNPQGEALIRLNMKILEDTFADKIYHGYYDLRFDNYRLHKPTQVALQLRDSQDKMAQYLRGQLLADSIKLLNEYDDKKPSLEQLSEVVAQDMTRIVRSQKLFDKERFAAVKLSERTTTLLAQEPQGNALSYLNRWLLEDACKLQPSHQWNESMLQIRYGVEEYFVPQGHGIDIENARGQITVEVAVSTAGESALRKIFIDDKQVIFE